MCIMCIKCMCACTSLDSQCKVTTNWCLVHQSLHTYPLGKGVKEPRASTFKRAEASTFIKEPRASTFTCTLQMIGWITSTLTVFLKKSTRTYCHQPANYSALYLCLHVLVLLQKQKKRGGKLHL